jgi:hypothetical protein
MNATNSLILVGLLAAIGGFAQSPAIPRHVEVAANECVRFQALASHGDVRVAITPHGGLAIARNGDDWTEIRLGFRTFLRSVTWGNGLFVAVGGSYVDVPWVILVSRDGIHWTRRNRRNRINLYGVVYGGGLYVAVGDRGTILTSQDALSWKRQESRTSDVLFSSVAFGDGTFVAAGDSDTVLSSTNGAGWQQQKISVAEVRR